VQAWFLAHFPKFYVVDPNPDYVENLLVVARRRLQKGHGEGVTYRSMLDRITFDDVHWRSYEDHREYQAIEEVLWYSGLIMCGDRRVYRHLPERVLRQYGYVQTIPRPPTDVAEMSAAEIAQAFLDFGTRTLKAADWVSMQERTHGVWKTVMYDGTLLCLTLRFCHFFRVIFQGLLMRSKSLMSSGSGTRREARLIGQLGQEARPARPRGGHEPSAVVSGHEPC